MFLNLAHTKLPVFEATRQLVLECYRLTSTFPSEERFSMVQQMRRAALSAHLNNAEGCSRKSVAERRRFFEVARGSVIELDTAADVSLALKYKTRAEFDRLGEYIVIAFKQLSGLIGE